jgi:hypothetical protein
MKKFQGLGKNLSKLEQKNIMGGLNGGESYTCEIEYTNGTSGTETVTADSVMDAKGQCIVGKSNVFNVCCTLA